MKKSIVLPLCICLFIVSFLTGCGSDTDDSSPLSSSEIVKMYQDPDSYKGRYVELSGEVLYVDGSLFQLYRHNVDYPDTTVVYISGIDNLTLNRGDYVIVSGTVDGTVTGTSFDGTATEAAAITAESVTISDYQTIVSPALKTLEVNQSQDHSGVTVTLEKIEFAAEETRFYIKIDNQSGADYTAFEFGSKAVQNGNNYPYRENFEADYPHFPDPIQSGSSAEAIFATSELNSSAALQFIFDGFSADPGLHPGHYTFDAAG